MELIPKDLFGIITQELTHQDIINLRFTCKYLHSHKSLSEIQSEKTRCFVTVVRNVNTVDVGKTLDSISPYITYWVIGDLDSDDDGVTEQFILDYFMEKKIPGEFHQMYNYEGAKTLTKLLNISKGKAAYIMFIEPISPLKLLTNGTEILKKLTFDCYSITLLFMDTKYPKQILYKGSLDWVFTGNYVCPYLSTKGKTHDTLRNPILLLK